MRMYGSSALDLWAFLFADISAQMVDAISFRDTLNGKALPFLVALTRW